MPRRTKHFREAMPGLRHILAYFWPDIRRELPLVAGSLVALCAAVVFQLLEPWPLKIVMDSIVESPRLSAEPSGVNVNHSLRWLTLAAVALVVIAIMRAAAEYASKVAFFMVGNRVIIKVRERLFRHVEALPLAFHRKARSGDLIIRVTRDVSLLRDVAATAVLPLVASCLILAGMVGLMLWLQWRLTLLSLTVIPLFWLTTLRIGRRIRRAARKQREREGAMAALAAEAFGAIDVVKALSLESTFASSFGRRNRDGQKQDLKTNRLSARLGCSVDVWLSAASAIVIWYGARSVLRGQLSPGELLLFLFYTKRALRPAQDFAKYAARLAKAAAAGERVIHLLEQSAEAIDVPHAVPAERLRGAVRFADVAFEYEPRRPVLRHVDFEVRPGQHVAIVGESGIGKSTLVGLMLRFYEPTQGTILIDGRDIREYTLDSLRRQISIVLQESVLFSTSVRDNIAFGAKGATLERIENAARLANAHEFISALQHGYDTLLGEKGASLSQGQRQRIAIARAMIRDAPIVVLDEPASSLDEENRQSVVEALQRLVEGRTTFLITHDLDLASRADLVFCLEQGQLSECGSHAELVESGGRYASVYRLQKEQHHANARDRRHALG